MEIHSKNVFKAKCQRSARAEWRWEFTEFKKTPCWEHLPKKGPLTKIDRSVKFCSKIKPDLEPPPPPNSNLSHSYFVINWSSQVDFSKLNSSSKHCWDIFLPLTELTFMVSVGRSFGVETLQGGHTEHMSAGPAASQLAVHASGLPRAKRIRPKQPTRQTTVVTEAGTNRPRWLRQFHSDRMSGRNKIPNVAIKPLRIWLHATFSFHHVIGWSDVCISKST